MDYTYLDSRVEELREELLADLKRWIAIPSVLGEAAPDAPFGAETRRMLDLAMETAERYGFKTRVFDGYCGDVSLGEAHVRLVRMLLSIECSSHCSLFLF